MTAMHSRACPMLHGSACYLYQCTSRNKCNKLDTAMLEIKNSPAKDPDAPRHKVHDKPQSNVEVICPEDLVECYDPNCGVGVCLAQQIERESTSLVPFKQPPGYLPNSTGTSAATTQPYKAPPPCHTGLTGLFFIGKCALFVCRESAADWTLWMKDDEGVMREEPVALHIDLIGSSWGSSESEYHVGGNAQAKAMLRPTTFVSKESGPVLHVNWPDYGTMPMLKRQWWLDLIEDLGEIDGNVVMFCQGGHGRTGTAAAILAGLLPDVLKEDECPVAWVRKQYCRSCVESGEQVRYIEAITGRAVKSSPAWAPVASNYSSKWTEGTQQWEKHKSGGKLKQRPLPLGRGKKNTVTLDKNGVPVLSNNLFKRRVKLARTKAAGSQNMIYKLYPDLGTLLDGQSFVVDGELFQWTERSNRFVWVMTPGKADIEQRVVI